MERQPRIFVGWPQGYFVSSLDPDFQKVLLEMIQNFGPPTIVEYRSANQGWITQKE